MPWVDLNHNPPGKTQPVWLYEFYIRVILQHVLVQESKQKRDLLSSLPARWEVERWASWFKQLAGTEEIRAEFSESASDFPAYQWANPCRDICVGNSSLRLNNVLSTSGFWDSMRGCSWVAKLYLGAPEALRTARTGLHQAGIRTGKEGESSNCIWSCLPRGKDTESWRSGLRYVGKAVKTHIVGSSCCHKCSSVTY